ncbi:threonine/serine exporter family protein [Martelella endophytica]|uniref:threonine/serine exporter family protein n=1 Tax=Martelella endophytica TaxID=1486262 RepID=UPI000A7DC833|nr:threonine/serine exporter family protein [Martelella endophytica]
MTDSTAETAAFEEEEGFHGELISRQRRLEEVALVALEAGKVLMETGAKSAVVREGIEKIAKGLGVRSVDIRVGFASISTTVGDGFCTSTHMVGVGHHGVNMRINHRVREICAEVARGGWAPDDVRLALFRAKTETPKHHRALNVFAAGLACAAFGRLLGADAPAFVTTLIASMAGQYVRLHLLERHFNPFVVTATVAFVAAVLSGIGAVFAGSTMVATSMSAAVLMLVPGVPSMNAQTDIMEGYPTLGSARFVSVAMILVFITVGVGAAHIVFGGSMVDAAKPVPNILHHAFFGAVAAAGFGVLFNFGYRNLGWAALAGALALAVRTFCMRHGWPLEAASFAAAIAVALAVELSYNTPFPVRRVGNAIAVAGCIPMVPGSAAAQWIIGLLEITVQPLEKSDLMLAATTSAGLQVIFTVGAIGAGLTAISSLFRRPEFPEGESR